MKISEAQAKAAKKYIKSLDEITIRAPKGTKDKIKECAKSKGKSVSSYIYDLVKEDMEKETK